MNHGSRQFVKHSLLWGFLLWLIGYALGFLFFMFVPPDHIGWVIMPFGIAVTLWVLFKRINDTRLPYYILLGIIWTLIAITFDYVFLVQLLKPADGYYKIDVFIYYGLTLLLPIIVGWWKLKKDSRHAIPIAHS